MKILVLGSAQDGGLPQIGCPCPHCQKAHAQASFRRMPPSIAVIDELSQEAFLVDATHALSEQLQVLQQVVPTKNIFGPLSGVLITHAHMGHYPGLMFLGREAGHSSQLPVFVEKNMGEFLKSNRPFSHLIQREEITLRVMQHRRPVHLTDRIQVTPIHVPHRDEDSRTFAFRFECEGKSLFYMPDHDAWTEQTLMWLDTCDLALVDGTFFSKGELPVGRMAEIGHPPILDSMEILHSRKDQVQILFTHLNHSNPAVDPESPEHKRVLDAGFQIAHEGQVFQL